LQGLSPGKNVDEMLRAAFSRTRMRQILQHGPQKERIKRKNLQLAGFRFLRRMILIGSYQRLKPLSDRMLLGTPEGVP
jgi:hypothetical protein